MAVSLALVTALSPCFSLIPIYTYADIDECSNTNICVLGSCINNVDGNFYECDCQDGAIVGTNSENLSVCLGLL